MSQASSRTNEQRPAISARTAAAPIAAGLRRLLATPIDPASLAVFRIGFGALVAWEVWRAFDTNLIRADYDLPRFTFRWWLFDWVRPLPGPLIYVAFAALGVTAALLAAGLFTRIAAGGTFVGMAYWFLLDKTSYLNHRYLATILAALFVVVPAGTAFSIDARRRASTTRKRAGPRSVIEPRVAIPAWPIWLMRFQVGVPYFFGGVAKLNFDWLVRAEPLRSALAVHADLPVVGAWLQNGGVAHVLAWGSAALDLSVPFLLLHRRTRVFAFAAALTFHLINARLFEIGIFPWLMIVATTVFFDPDWPRRIVAVVRRQGAARRTVIGGAALGLLLGALVPESISVVRAAVGAFGVAVLAFHVSERRASVATVRTSSQAAVGRPVRALLTVWIAAQLLVPLVHFAIPGNVYWTEEGNRFSWHMLVRVKTARVVYELTDPATGRTWREDPARYLTRYQLSKLDLPDMILTLAHHIEDAYRARGIPDLEVRVDARASLNMRRPQRYIKRHVDLTEIDRPYVPPADWIVPLRPHEERRTGLSERRTRGGARD